MAASVPANAASTGCRQGLERNGSTASRRVVDLYGRSARHLARWWPQSRGCIVAGGEERRERGAAAGAVGARGPADVAPKVEEAGDDKELSHDDDRAEVLTLAVVGRDGAGKTRLVAELLRLQNTQDQNHKPLSLSLGQPSADELTKEESSAHFNTTLYNHLYTVDCKTHTLQLIDSPGHIDRLPHVDMALRVASAAVFVIKQTMGMDASAERVWERIPTETPAAIFISQVDQGKPDGFLSVVGKIGDQLGVQLAVLNLPYYNGETGELLGIIDVVEQTLFVDSEDSSSSQPLPEDAKPLASEWISKLIEVLAEAEVDDEVMECYLEEKIPSREAFLSAIKKGVQQRIIVPLLCGSSSKGVGAAVLDRFVVSTFSSNLEEKSSMWVGDGANGLEEIVPDPSSSFVGYVFGTHWDKYAGKCCDVMVLRGKLRPGTKIIEGESQEKYVSQKLMRWSRVGELEALKGDWALPGDMVVLDHCDSLQINHTVCDPNHPIVLDPVKFEKPRCTFKLELGGKDDDKVLAAIHKLMEEDPTLRLSRNDETGELLLSGMGNMHLELVKERLQETHGIELHLSVPRIAYHETPTRNVEGYGRHKKQSGGHGQFGVASIRMEPLTRGSGVEFVNEIKGGVIPKQYIGSVERGVRDAFKNGPLGGFPVVDCRVVLFDGKTHSVDSGDAAFFQAGVLAARDALSKCRCCLLEPLMRTKIDIPESDVGTVSKDLLRRRGQVVSVNPKGHMSVIEAICPLSQMLGYSSDLQQMTSGLGMFGMQLEQYQEVPQNLVSNILQPKKKAT